MLLQTQSIVQNFNKVQFSSRKEDANNKACDEGIDLLRCILKFELK